MSTPGNHSLCLSSSLSLRCNTANPETTRNLAKCLRGTKTRSPRSPCFWLGTIILVTNWTFLPSDTCGCEKHCLYPTKGWLSTGDTCGVGERRPSSAGVAKMLCALASVGSRNWPPALSCCFLLWASLASWLNLEANFSTGIWLISWTSSACCSWGTQSSAWPRLLEERARALTHIKHSLLLHCHPPLLWLQREKKKCCFKVKPRALTLHKHFHLAKWYILLKYRWTKGECKAEIYGCI